jgi:uncharacterized membrane protein SirB2
MTYFYLLKTIHVTTALLSISGFAVRGYWRLNAAPQLKRKWVRIAPHIVDTLLLLSAIALAWHLAQYPFVQPWLTAKLIGLVVYILLGLTVMRFAKRRATQFTAYVLAIITFLYIVSVALTHSVIPAA